MDQDALSRATRIPSLAEVFERYPRVAINCDLKDGNPVLVDKVCELVKKCDRAKYTIVGGGAHVSTRLRERSADIPQFFSARSIINTALLYWIGLLPFFPLSAQYLELPYVTRDLQNNLNAAKKRGAMPFPAWLVRLLAYTFTSRTFIRHVQSRGVKVSYWVLNQRSDFQDALQLGADGIMTDFPSRLTAYVSSQPDLAVEGGKA